MARKLWLLIICVSLILVGCGGDNEKREDVIVIEGNDVATEDNIERGLKKFSEKALMNVEDENIAAFKELFSDEVEESMIDDLYQFFSKILSGGYNDMDYLYLISDEDIQICQIIASGCSGIYPNTHVQYCSYGLCLGFIENEWKVVPAGDQQKVLELLPVEAQDAFINGRDFVTFNNYSWLEEDCVYNGALDCTVYAAWENKDGSVSVLVNFKNGTDEVRTVTETQISLYSESLQQNIVSLTGGGSQMLAVGKSGTYVITSEQEEVSINDWGERVSYKINTKHN